MRKGIFIVSSLILLILTLGGYKFISSLNKISDAFVHEHKIDDPTFVLIEDSISQNGKYKYFIYQFDNGGLGYSRVFWSVVENSENINDLDKGILPDGYRIKGWDDNELIIEKWDPHYYKSKIVDLKTGSKFNGVEVRMENE